MPDSKSSGLPDFTPEPVRDSNFRLKKREQTAEEVAADKAKREASARASAAKSVHPEVVDRAHRAVSALFGAAGAALIVQPALTATTLIGHPVHGAATVLFARLGGCMLLALCSAALALKDMPTSFKNAKRLLGGMAAATGLSAATLAGGGFGGPVALPCQGAVLALASASGFYSWQLARSLRLVKAA